MVQRCACLLFVEYRSKHQHLSSDAIANIICTSNLPGVDFQHCKGAVSKMTTFGSYYRNMERTLGKGVTLALGTNVAETT